MSGPPIHPRADWGFPGWADPKRPPESVADSARTEFFVHYEGGTPTRDAGAQAMRNIHAGHQANGWAGIGYHFVVMLDGSAWEGRGWTLAGAHCPDHNTTGYGVQVHIGGDQQPSPAALRTCRALYDEACSRSGRQLAMRGHRDGYATECPGEKLYAWVRAGMPAPMDPPPTTQEDQMGVFVEPEGALPGDGVYWVDGSGVHGVSRARWDVLMKRGGYRAVTIPRAEYNTLVAQVVKPVPPLDVRALAEEIVAELPPVTAAGGPTAAEIADVVLSRLQLVQRP